MPPKAKPPAETEPRRSTRAKAKRPADTEKQLTPTKQAKKKTGPKSQSADGEDESSSLANQPQHKVVATPEHAAIEDTSIKASKTSKASKNTKATKQQAAHSADTKHTDDEPLADSTLSTLAAQKPSTSAAGTKSGLPSDSNQAAVADPACPKAHSTKVTGDADVMLNQTNIGIKLYMDVTKAIVEYSLPESCIAFASCC